MKLLETVDVALVVWLLCDDVLCCVECLVLYTAGLSSCC